MKLVPIYTEKTTKLAKDGKYTLLVDMTADKGEIKRAILKVFGVHVKEIRTINVHGEDKRNMKGHKVRVPAQKKAVITIAKGEKLDLFEEKKK